MENQTECRMKLSFSLSSKPSLKPIQHKPAENFIEDNSQDDGEIIKHEYVTEFDPSKSLNRSEKLVIPPIPNQWRPHQKTKNLDDPGVGFEVEAPSTGGILDSGMSYGLNLRQAKQDEKAGKRELDPLTAFSGPGEDLKLQKFKEDIKNLPDDRGLDEFVDVSVEGFGAALLAGYGWHEGRGIGRNAKEDVKVVEYNGRTGMAGLGFVTDLPGAKNHRRSPEQCEGIIALIETTNQDRRRKGDEKRGEGLRHCNGRREEERISTVGVGKEKATILL